MTYTMSPLFPEELVECIAEGRDPTVHELFAVAERVWSDGGSDRSAFAWGELPPGSIERREAMSSALLALRGVPEV